MAPKAAGGYVVAAGGSPLADAILESLKVLFTTSYPRWVTEVGAITTWLDICEAMGNVHAVGNRHDDLVALPLIPDAIALLPENFSPAEMACNFLDFVGVILNNWSQDSKKKLFNILGLRLHFVTRYQLEDAWSSGNALRQAKTRLIQLHLTKMQERGLSVGNTVGFGMNGEHAQKLWEVIDGTMETEGVNPLQMVLILSTLLHVGDCMGFADPNFGFLEFGGSRSELDALVQNDSGFVLKCTRATMVLVVGFAEGSLRGNVKVRGAPTDQADAKTKLVFMSSVFHHTNRQLNLVWPSTMKVVPYYKRVLDLNEVTNDIVKEQFLRLRALMVAQVANEPSDDDETEAATSIPDEFDALSNIIKSSNGEEEMVDVDLRAMLDANLAEDMTYINQLTATVRSENQTCADAATDQSEEFVTASSQGD